MKIVPFLVTFLLFICAYCTNFSTAQAQLFDVNTNASLVTNPTYPTPYTKTLVSLSAYAINTSGASIRWYFNGTEVPGTQDARDISITTGPLGLKTLVKAVVTPPGKTPIILEHTITPSQLDLIVVADTLVPNLYEGRALPIGDEPVSITAILHDGTGNLGTLTYTWRLGTTVLFGGPVINTPTVTFAMPKSESTLSVTIENSAGKILSKRAVSLKPARPELHFYENNPLRGQSMNSIKDSFTLIGDETTVRAEPYYIAQNIFTKDPVWSWTLDGREVDNVDNDPQTITLRGTGGSGFAKVGFKLTNTKSLLQYVNEFFTIYFESRT